MPKRSKISEHFWRYEFSCKCGCGFNAADIELVELLESVRKYFDQMVLITSGCRCERQNRKVGGAPNSFHLKGMAADFIVQHVSPEKVADYLEAKYNKQYGIGRYPSWTHLDVREGKSGRWGKN